MTKTVKKRLQAVVALLVTLMIMAGVMPTDVLDIFTKGTEVKAASNRYRVANTTLWDYAYDDASFAYNNRNDVRGGVRQDADLSVPYDQLNAQLSTYYASTATSAVPLYFGNFYGTRADRRWQSRYDSGSDYYYDGSNGYTRFKLGANLAPSGNNGKVAVQGLVDKKLSGGSEGTITAGNKPMLQFGNTTGKITKYTISDGENKGFFFDRTERNGIVTYSYDSYAEGDMTQNNRYYDSGWGGFNLTNGPAGIDGDGHCKGGGFFPFNNQGIRIDDSDRPNVNYGFGLRLQIPFKLTSNGQLTGTNGTPQDITFEFSGDDDIWIFIDGYLILDIGGDHGRVKGEINFGKGYRGEPGAVHIDNALQYSSISSSQNFGDGSAYNKTLENAFKSVDSNYTWDTSTFFNKSTTHTMVIYYMERGMFESNFKTTFNYVPDDDPDNPENTPTPTNNQFKIREVTSFTGVNAGLQALTKQAADNDVFKYILQTDQVTGEDGVQGPTYDYYQRQNTEAATQQNTMLTGQTITRGTDSEHIYFDPSVRSSDTWYRGDNSGMAVIVAWVYVSNEDGRVVYPSSVGSSSPYLHQYDLSSLLSDHPTYNRVKFVRLSPNGAASYSDGSSSQPVSDWNGRTSGANLSMGHVYSGADWSTNCTLTVSENAVTISEPYSYENATIAGDGVVKGTNYVWKDDKAQQITAANNLTDTIDGMTGRTSATDGSFHLMYGTSTDESSATFLKQFPSGSTLRLEQNGTLKGVLASARPATATNSGAIGTDGIWFGTSGKSDTTGTSLSTYYTTTYTLYDETTSTDVTSTRLSDDQGGLKQIDYSSTAPDTVNLTLTVTNTVNNGIVKVKKTLTSGTTTDKFRFKATITNILGDPNVKVPTGGYGTITVDGAALNSSGGATSTLDANGYFWLAAGTEATISVPVGTTVAIAEELESGMVSNYTVTVKDGVNSQTVADKDGNYTIEIQNAPVQQQVSTYLKVQKVWKNSDASGVALATGVKFKIEKLVNGSWEYVADITLQTSNADVTTDTNAKTVTWTLKDANKRHIDQGVTYRILEYAKDNKALILLNEGLYDKEWVAKYSFDPSGGESPAVQNQKQANTDITLSVMNEYSPIQTGGMPKTGARGVYAIVTFGAFAITIAGVALLIYRKKLQTVNIYAVKGSEKKKE